MCQLDWVSPCCCYWSWWVPDRHKEHRQQWLRPATCRSWKVWRNDPKPCRICWVDEYKCWSWKTNLWFWVWTVLFIVFRNVKDYEQIRNKITQYVVMTENYVYVYGKIKQNSFTQVAFISSANVVQICSKYLVSPKDRFVFRVVLWVAWFLSRWNIYQYFPYQCIKQ